MGMGGEVTHPDPNCASKFRGADRTAVAQKLSFISNLVVS